jgi:hypothetical protein
MWRAVASAALLALPVVPPLGEPWLGTPAAPSPPPDPTTCPTTPHGAVVDRATQRAWLCTDGAVVRVMAITSARSQPDPAVYAVYAKDMQTTSSLGGHDTVLEHFVAFTRGENMGARIGFHAVPRLADGTLVQPLESVGSSSLFGASSGCIRVRPADAEAVWDHLAVGDQVNVVS